MAFPILGALGAVGAIGSLFGGRSAQKAQKEQLRRQGDIAGQQANLFRQATPYYNALLQNYAQQLGLNVAPPQTITQNTGAMRSAGGLKVAPVQRQVANPAYAQYQQQQAAQPAQGGLLGSNWGTQADQLRLQQAEEDINRASQQRANQLRFQLGSRGIADSTIAAALAQNEARAGDEFARFRRGLAVAAPQEQTQRLGQMLGFLGPALGAGSSAAGIYGGQGALFGQQAAGNYGTIGQLAQQYAYQDALRRRMRQPTTYGTDDYSDVYMDPYAPYWGG